MILFMLFNLDNNDVLAFLRNNNAHNKYHLSNLHSSKSPHICQLISLVAIKQAFIMSPSVLRL